MSHLHLTQAPVRGARLKSQRVAIHCGERTVTWGEFADRVARLAGVLQDMGVGQGTAVTGAGGLLDRVDALCFAAPVFFHSVRWYFGL